MDDTRTRLNCAIPALRSAISKLDSFSRCLPTPLVRKIFFGTYALLIAPVGPPNTFAGGPQPSPRYRAMSDPPVVRTSVDAGEELTGFDRLAGLHEDLGQHAGARRLDLVLHLHRLEHQDSLAA